MSKEFAEAMNAGIKAMGEGIRSFTNHSANAAARANAVSEGAQTAAKNFNQTSADIANNINTQTLAAQYSYNSAGANLANDYTTNMWNTAAAWNEEMFNRQMEFNAEQAQKQRDWAERMDNTKYQRAMADMKAGGLNPILAYGGINSSASGSAASVSAPQMGYAQGAQPSGGLLGANDASISGYNGQAEYMGGMLGLLGAGLEGLSSAMSVLAQAGLDKNSDFLGFIKEILAGDDAKITYRKNHSYTKEFMNKIRGMMNHDKWENGDYNPADRIMKGR